VWWRRDGCFQISLNAFEDVSICLMCARHALSHVLRKRDTLIVDDCGRKL
jgi:hypothetical protein